MCFVSCWGWLYVEGCDIKRGGNGIWGDKSGAELCMQEQIKLNIDFVLQR